MKRAAKQSTERQVRTLALVKSKRVRVVGHVTGHVVSASENEVLVEYPGNPHGPLPARSLIEFAPSEFAKAASSPIGVLLVFEQERSDSPIIVGLVRTPAIKKPAEECEPLAVAELDGKRVVLTAQDEIVLRCGQASIVLRRNGRVVIRGTYIETRSEGVHRIKGGTVQIN